MPPIISNKNLSSPFFSYPFAFPCKDLSTAIVIKSLTQLFVLFGLPMNVHSDRGAAFMARDFRNYLVKRGVAASRSTRYHPTGNSQVERTNKTIWKTVQLMVCDQQIPVERWQDVLPDALHALGPYCVRQLTAHHMKDFSVSKDGPSLGKIYLLGYYKKDQFCYADLFEIEMNLWLTKLIYSMLTPVNPSGSRKRPKILRTN